jgi:ABC-2 type transport system permease protein
MRAALAVGHKEFRQIVRDRRTLMTLLFVPALFLLLYGYALNFDIRDIRLTVQDRDTTAESRALVSTFVNSGYFTLAAGFESSDDLTRLIDRSDARAALVIPSGYGRHVTTGRPVTVQVIVDGDNANTASTVVGYVQSLIAETSAQYEVRLAGAGAGIAPIRFEPRVWYNPQLRSALFLIPGLIAYIAMITAVISTALAIVREKERGTMEQVRMAPVGPVAFVVGKTLPYLAISFASALLVIVVSMALFDLPMRGSWWLLCLAIGLFLVGAQAQGLLISTVANTQQVAFQMALLSSFLPTFILSGFIFPLSSMPAPVQLITHVVPARYFIVALRAIVLKGVGLAAFWPELAALATFAAAATALASLRLWKEWR